MDTTVCGTECPGIDCWVHGIPQIKIQDSKQVAKKTLGPQDSEEVVKARSGALMWKRSLEARAKDEKAALASSTASQYRGWWERYHKFLSHCSKMELLYKSEGVTAFLAHLAEESKGLGGVSTAKAALAHTFKTEGFNVVENPANSVQVKLVMRGIHRRFALPPTKKTPITLEQLEKVVRAATHNLNWNSCKLVDFRLAAQLTFMFATAARYGEAREIKCGQMSKQGNHLHILFKKGKTYQFGENRSSVIADRPGKAFNPRVLLEEYWKRLNSAGRGESDDYLFPNLGQKAKEPASYSAVLNQFKHFLKVAGVTIDLKKFGLHSMRRGSATTLANAGTPDHHIQKHMRVVTQDTVRRYATLNMDKLREVSQTVFNS